jgi:hypothetical protein
MKQDIIRRYFWLLDIIYQAGTDGLTYEQISNKWQKNDSLSNGELYPWRTFMNHRNKIRDIFGVDIACNKSYNTYYIADTNDIKNATGFKSWLLDTMTVNNRIDDCAGLKERILLEQNPSGKEYLSTILEAMRDNNMITFDYKPFWGEEERVSNLFHVEPYALKVFKRRWYLLAKYGESPFKIYALDRILNIDIEFEYFKIPPQFSAEAFFNSYFGVIISDDDPQAVKLKVNAFQAKYIRTLPLHHSQKELETTEEYSLFSFIIHTTYDFIQELLSLGESIEVLEPKKLRMEMARLGKAIKRNHS